MPSAVYICYFCREVFTLSAKHQCQPECDKLTGFHRDFCPRCKHRDSCVWEKTFPTRNPDDVDSA